MTREAHCPCCTTGDGIERDPCQECKGTGLASVAYDTARTHIKLLEEQLYRLREAVSPGRIGKPEYDIGVAARPRPLDTVIKPAKIEVFSRPECIFNYCPNPERCQEKCEQQLNPICERNKLNE